MSEGLNSSGVKTMEHPAQFPPEPQRPASVLLVTQPQLAKLLRGDTLRPSGDLGKQPRNYSVMFGQVQQPFPANVPGKKARYLLFYRLIPSCRATCDQQFKLQVSSGRLHRVKIPGRS